jgi:hypothetical protein
MGLFDYTSVDTDRTLNIYVGDVVMSFKRGGESPEPQR